MKFLLYSINLVLFIISILIFYNTSNVTIRLPKINIERLSGSSSLSSFSSSASTSSSSHTSPASHIRNTKTSPNKIRRFAIYSSSIHSKLRSYIFYTPITAAAWQRIGYEVIVVFTGDFTNNSNASFSPQLNLTRKFLQRLGVYVLDFQCNASYSIKLSQLVRLFSGFLPDTIVNDRDLIITTDSDIIPLDKDNYQLQENIDGFIYRNIHK